MAFATSNVQLGNSGDSWVLTGKWSGLQADAAGTVKIGGAFVTQCIFYETDTSDNLPEVRPTAITLSTNSTTGITTINVHNHSNVNNGVFRVVYR